MKSSKKLYKKKMQPPKYNPGALLAPLAGLAAAPATGAAATGALSAGTSAAIAGATGATAAGAATAVTGATSAAGTLPNLSALPTLNATLPSSSNVIPSIPAGTTLPPVPKGAASTVNAASGASAKMPFSKNTSILGSSKDEGWTGQFAEDMATGNNVNAGNTVNTGNSFKGATQPKGASAQIKDMMELDSLGDIVKLSTGQLPMAAITGIRQSALERQKSRNNQMNFANNMNVNMDSGAYGDSGMMKKGGIMNSVAELTGQEYIVPRELIPYALEAGNAKLYASDKTEGAYSHETNPIQVYETGGGVYMDEQGNTMKAGDLIVPEHKANSRAGIMSAINQNPYNNKALLGKIIEPDAYREQKGLDKYDAMAGMAAYTLGNNIMNRFRAPQQINSPALVNPKIIEYNPYFLSEQAQRLADSVYNTSQYTRSGSLSDNMAAANASMQAAGDIINKQSAVISETQQQYDMENARQYNTALISNAEQINKIKAANAQLAFEHDKNISAINQSNNEMLSQSLQGIQQLSNDKETADMNKLAMQYALEVQKIDSENATALSKYNADIAQWSKDRSLIDPDKQSQWENEHKKPEIPESIKYPSFDLMFKNNPVFKKIFGNTILNNTNTTPAQK